MVNKGIVYKMSYNQGKNNPSFNKRKHLLLSYKFLYNEYIINFKSAIMIAKETGIAYSTVQLYLERLNIKRRSKSESQKLFLNHNGSPCKGRHHTQVVKEKLSLSHGGTGIPYENSKYPEEFNFNLKSKIRKRDNYLCKNCNMTEEEHLTVYGRNLIIHHIDYNKHNCKEDNLISVCFSCNIRANFNRVYWKDFYKVKIKEILKNVASTI